MSRATGMPKPSGSEAWLRDPVYHGALTNVNVSYAGWWPSKLPPDSGDHPHAARGKEEAAGRVTAVAPMVPAALANSGQAPEARGNGSCEPPGIQPEMTLFADVERCSRAAAASGHEIK